MNDDGSSEIAGEMKDVDNIQIQVQSQLMIGEECSKNDDSKGALSAFNKAISLDPSCDMAWFNRGVLLEAQQDARGARQAFQICLDVNPNHAPATANLCILLERIGDDSGAYDMSLRALEFYPGHPAIMEVKERCSGSKTSKSMEEMTPVVTTDTFKQEDMDMAMSEGGVEDVNAVLEEAVHHDMDDNQKLDIDELRSAVDVVAATENIQEKIELVQPVTQSIPQETVDISAEEIINEANPTSVDLDLLVEEATQLIRNGDPASALKSLKPYLKNEAASHAPSWRIAGGAMARLDLDEHAISALEHAQKLDPSNAKGWFNLGSVKQRIGYLEEAGACYANALREDPNYIKPAIKWSETSREIKDIEGYLTAATVISTLEPENPIKMELIITLIELAEGESEVLELASGLPPTLPEGPELAANALALLGEGQTELHARAFSAMNNHVESVTIWKSLIQLQKTNPILWRGLSKSLRAAGDMETSERCRIKADSLEQVNNEVEPQPSEEKPQQDITEQVQNRLSSKTIDIEEQNSANELLLTPIERAAEVVVEPEANPQVDLAKAALDVQQNSLVSEEFKNPISNSIANQDISWYNQGVALIEAGKYSEALSCFDRALPSFANDDEMVIRILNGRGNAFYFLENYPACVESYHQAMLIRPEDVRGKTLYNMGTAYAEMERYQDSIKCFEQAIPRGLNKEEVKRTKEQIRRCNILLKEQIKKQKN
ncbi:MAG: tetratricopeptide repeat protein [Candidatus Poseidoniaceae archaeon]|nr:tetratricopeptide repeat protein [Candidatus Poseidoniaceae archaeon]